MSNLNEILNNLPDEDMDIGDPESWTEQSDFPPPPPAGKYTFKPINLRSVEVKVLPSNGTKFTEAVLDLQVVGGEFDNRKVTFQRVNTLKRSVDGQSDMIDLLKSAGVEDGELVKPTSHEIATHLSELIDEGALVQGSLDWKGFSAEAYNAKLVELTKAGSPETAKKVATQAQKKEAGAYANVARNYRDFPDAKNGIGKIARMLGPMGEKVEAQAVVRKFTPAE